MSGKGGKGRVLCEYEAGNDWLSFDSVQRAGRSGSSNRKRCSVSMPDPEKEPITRGPAGVKAFRRYSTLLM